MVVPEVPELLSLKPKQTPKPPSNNSTATNSTDDTLTSEKIATPVPSVNNSAEVTVVVVEEEEEEDSECEALRTEVEDMDLEEGTNVEDLAVVEEDTDVVGMGEEDMVVVEEDMGVVVEEEGDMVVGMEDMLDREGWVEEEEGVVNLILLMILPIMHLLVETLPTSFMCRMYSPLSLVCFGGGLTNG